MYRKFDPEKYEYKLKKILLKLKDIDSPQYKEVRKILSQYVKDDGDFFSKDELISGYHFLVEKQVIDKDDDLLQKIRMKPTRTMSGVTTVTVLTKPYPCPGNCIFCPDDIRMPKSYLSSEPGAQRAEKNRFDPFLQTFNRLVALHNIGHNTDKIELIILGGTWSFYPEEYQIWFIKECFRGLNAFNDDFVNEKDPDKYDPKEGSATWEELIKEQVNNETAFSRCVGLVVETRPDYISEDEVLRIRKLGATKVQIGIQSLDDEILVMNGRGHTVKETTHAIKLLRSAGFKIHAHWMANLYGSSISKDISDYKKLWHTGIQPDELKLYPTSILAGTALNKLYEKGKYKPFDHEELMTVVTEAMRNTPRYCRITRVIRDIPSTDIIEGNKYTNFRELAERELIKRGDPCQCIRCREIRDQKLSEDDLVLDKIVYETSIGTDIFLSFKTKISDKIAGFLRLTLPNEETTMSNFVIELRNKAIIREVHVYGQVVGIGDKEEGRTQHLGIGKKLIAEAEYIAKEKDYKGIAVISAIGTRQYYRKLGYVDGELYLNKEFQAYLN